MPVLIEADINSLLKPLWRGRMRVRWDHRQDHNFRVAVHLLDKDGQRAVPLQGSEHRERGAIAALGPGDVLNVSSRMIQRIIGSKRGVSRSNRNAGAYLVVDSSRFSSGNHYFQECNIREHRKHARNYLSLEAPFSLLQSTQNGGCRHCAKPLILGVLGSSQREP